MTMHAVIGALIPDQTATLYGIQRQEKALRGISSYSTFGATRFDLSAHKKARMKTFALGISLFLVTSCLLRTTRPVIDLPSRSTQLVHQSTVAQDIVETFYENTFAVLQSCGEDEPLIPCLHRIQTLNSTTTSWPWWFKTLLRDASACHYMHGLQGVCDGNDAWHNVIMNASPTIRMCLIDKIATKQWRKVWTLLSNTTAKLNTKEWDKVYLDSNSHIELENQDDTTPKVVFLRDPLERFLSAFLDKCIGKKRREEYCWPHAVYYSKETYQEKNIHTRMLSPQEQFEQFVDVMPLQWNVHFAPLGLSCNGLYRNLYEYDFVGYMGDNFYSDLQRMGRRYGPLISKALNETFSLDRGLRRSGTETAAISKVEQFYTPRTLRKVLEYMSLDYVRMNLSIPEWAERMLRDENDFMTTS